MIIRDVNEKNTIEFVYELLNYYSKIDNNSINRVLTSSDKESMRNNIGWYQHVDNKHKIFINVPNLLYLKDAIKHGDIDINTYYAFISLCVSHEFRHFLQGKCIWDGEEIDGYGQKDVLNSQLMLYIRFFFDAYYLLNKGYVKYEEDAEKFAIKSSYDFFNKNYPNMSAEKAIVNASNYYAEIQSRQGAISTLPRNCNSIDELISKIDIRIKDNLRINKLDETLRVFNPKFYANHIYYGLDENLLITDELIDMYSKISNGNEKDLFVVKHILSNLDNPIESLEEFPLLKKKYLSRNI